MAWETIETPNAKYVLIFSKHSITTEKSPINYDALILESGLDTPQGTMQAEQYAALVEQAAKNNNPVWVTDVAPTQSAIIKGKTMAALPVLVPLVIGAKLLLGNNSAKTTPRRQALKKIFAAIMLGASGATFADGVFLGRSKSQIKNPAYWKLSSKYTELFLGKGIITIRNAVTAEKTEKFIAPQLQKELGRKPVIAIVFGDRHYGIKEHLLFPHKRRQVLHKNNLEKYIVPEYERSYRIALDKAGKVWIVEERQHELKKLREKQKVKTPKPVAQTRRTFLRRFLGRKA